MKHNYISDYCSPVLFIALLHREAMCTVYVGEAWEVHEWKPWPPLSPLQSCRSSIYHNWRFSPVGSTPIQLSEGSEELEQWPPVRMPPAIGSNISFDLLTSMGHGLVSKVVEE